MRNKVGMITLQEVMNLKWKPRKTFQMVFHWLIQGKYEQIPVRMQRKRNIKLKTARPVS